MRASPKLTNRGTSISKATNPRWCSITLLCFQSIRQSIFEVEPRNRIPRWRPLQPSCFSKWQQLQKQLSLDGADRAKHLLGRVRKRNFTMATRAAILFFKMEPFTNSNVKSPRWCPTTLFSFKSISRSLFELVSRNKMLAGRWMDRHGTHQSNRQFGYTQPTPKN